MNQKAPLNVIASYIAVILMMCLALGLTLMIHDYVTPMISPLFLFVVVISAWRFGLPQAILGTLIAGLFIDFFFIDPIGKLTFEVKDNVRLIIFSLEGLGFALLINSTKRSSEAVRASREQILALSLRESAAREEERKRVSLEVHDELGQSLTSLKMQLHLLKRNAGEHHRPEAKPIADSIDPLLDVVDNTIASVRRIATELRPPVLDDLGLVPALEWQVHEFKRVTGIDCTFRSNVDNLSLSGELATAIFRIFQEALTNITRHAAATNVLVLFQELNTGLELRVEDDGVGIHDEDQGKGNSSLGILGMRERARNIGGTLDVLKGAEHGTVIRLSVPMGIS